MGTTFKPCRAVDLRKLTLLGLVRFSIKALQEYPPRLFRQGQWITTPADITDPESCDGDGRPLFRRRRPDGKYVAIFHPSVKARKAYVCAVGAVLACDGPRAAADWLLTSRTTRHWRAGENAAGLLGAMSSVFEGEANPSGGRRKTLRFLKHLERKLARTRSDAVIDAALAEACQNYGAEIPDHLQAA